MGLLEDYTTGIGMPRPTREHQIVMSYLHVNLCNELMPKGLRPLTESPVTDDLNDKVPDLVVFDSNYKQLFLIIEIATHRDCKKTIHKCDELMERFPQIECFVYDYEANVWYTFDAEANEWYNSAEYEIQSRYLEHPLPFYLG